MQFFGEISNKKPGVTAGLFINLMYDSAGKATITP